MTISNVRAMDGIMNCVDYKFTLSAKSNIFAVISFSDADTLISIWRMNYLYIVHSSCLSSQSGAKFDNHLGETSQANDGSELNWNFTAQPSPFLHFSKRFWDLFVTPNTISASLLKHFLSWAWTTRPTDIWLILSPITGLVADFFVVKRWTMIRINQSNIGKIELHCKNEFCWHRIVLRT